MQLETKSQPNEKSCTLDNLKILKAEYGKTDKETLKPTAFDPRSSELDPVSFMDQLKAGLQEHASSAVVLQILPQATPVEVSEENVTETVSMTSALIMMRKWLLLK